jgi:hypothetical protein
MFVLTKCRTLIDVVRGKSLRKIYESRKVRISEDCRNFFLRRYIPDLGLGLSP